MTWFWPSLNLNGVPARGAPRETAARNCVPTISLRRRRRAAAVGRVEDLAAGQVTDVLDGDDVARLGEAVAVAGDEDLDVERVRADARLRLDAVSYTHLTLPTIYSV